MCYIICSIKYYSLRKQRTFHDATTAWFPLKMTSENLEQKFHPDDASLPRSW